MLLDNFARQLSHDLNLDEPLTADAEGIYSVGLDTLSIEISWLDPGFYFESVVGFPKRPPWGEETLLLFLLANLFGQGTGGGTLALDASGERLSLTYALPYELTYGEFRNHLESVANYAEYWTMKTKQLAEAEAGS